MFLRGAVMFHHPKAALCTTTLVRNAFFGPQYPREKVKEFEKWMAPYESLGWPSGTIGSWRGGRNVWLDVNYIVRNISTIGERNGGDRVMVMLGTEDKMMQGTQQRMVAEYSDAIRKVEGNESSGGEDTSRNGAGVRLVEIKGAGHHLQNDVQWEEGAKALLDFLQQI